MAIDPKYLTFSSVLNKRLFRIPNYQRAYSWETKQRSELFEDIEKLKLYDFARHHFMSTVVCLRKDKIEEVGTDELEVLDVVDGQQRLTTLIILLKAISKKLSVGTAEEQKESENLDELLVKGDKRLILLQTNHDDSNIFSNYLTKGNWPSENIISTTAIKNLAEAFSECESFVEGWNSKWSTLDLLKTIKNRLDFIFYVLEDEASVYTVFEVLNSRGLEVDWLDKCKSMLMGIAFEKFSRAASNEHIIELHKLWSNIYKIIGIKFLSGREILSFAATLLNDQVLSKPLSVEDSIELFRDKCNEDASQIIEITNWILLIATNLKELYDNPRIKAVTDVSHARLLAVAIMSSGVLKPYEINEALQYWEKITFRIFGLCRKDSRYRVGDYTKLAYRIVNESLTKQEIVDELKTIGSSFSINEAIKGLQETDCYNGWENDLKYFLYRYEEYLASQAGESVSKEVWEKIWSSSPSTTIEHIHPQQLNDNWKDKISNRQDYVDKHVNRIGNLLLLPPNLNSKAGRKPFNEKKIIYKSTNLRMVNEVISKDDWTREEIEKREKRLIDFAKKTWND